MTNNNGTKTAKEYVSEPDDLKPRVEELESLLDKAHQKNRELETELYNTRILELNVRRKLESARDLIDAQQHAMQRAGVTEVAQGD